MGLRDIALGAQPKESRYLFPSPRGDDHPVNPQALTRAFIRLRDALKMVDMRIAQPVTMFLDAVASSGHTLVVGHRNVNKMIMRNLLGLSFEEGYQVEHKHNCLYVYAPKIRQIFFARIGNPGTIIELQPGYKKID